MDGENSPDKDYGLGERKTIGSMEPPRLPYLPQNPVSYKPEIGLIGCGGISVQHLTAYREAGYRITALCDIDKSRVEKMRDEFYPEAKVYTSPEDVISLDNIEVLDIATHPDVRYGIMEKGVKAGKHILSQKPFVTDLALGRQLTEKAAKKGVIIAVNQNGRWAPHFSYIRHAIEAGLIGEVFGTHLTVNWNHNWIKGTPFEKIKYLVMYDFGIHWFDILTAFMGKKIPGRVFATTAFTTRQEVKPPLLSQVIIEYDNAQASICFQGDVLVGEEDRTFVAGTNGVLKSEGPDLNTQTVTLTNIDGFCSPNLSGSWFPGGFHGTMGELLCAVEENRTPVNGAKDNLKSLELCFAALFSVKTGEPVKPGMVEKLIH